jgi:uncharacterized protein (TIGR03084 family)
MRELVLMPADMAGLQADLAAETADFDAILARLSPPEYLQPTPAPGWCISDQVSHLAHYDEETLLAATDPGRFRAEAAAKMATGGGSPDEIAARHRETPGPQLRAWLTRARGELLAWFASADPAARLPWYGPDMSVASCMTARLMETWAHGQDVADALGHPRPATGRLRHIAHLGVRTAAFSFTARGLPVPDRPVLVELAGPEGQAWTWGPADAADVVRGPALDFCLVVTQRRHPADTALTADGAVARQWLSIAQAFAGPPGPGRAPSSAA